MAHSPKAPEVPTDHTVAANEASYSAGGQMARDTTDASWTHDDGSKRPVGDRPVPVARKKETTDTPALPRLRGAGATQSSDAPAAIVSPTRARDAGEDEEVSPRKLLMYALVGLVAALGIWVVAFDLVGAR